MAEVKRESLSEWLERWDESQWGSQEWRGYLKSLLADCEAKMDRLSRLEQSCDKQKAEIKSLEKQNELLQRQLELLQKTLDVVERASRPIVIPDTEEVRKYV
jgi:Fic family protein